MPNLPAPPSPETTSLVMLQNIAGLSGVVTDYNPGSQIRTLAESVGGVIEQQGVINQALAANDLIQSAWSILNISPLSAQPAACSTVVFRSSNYPGNATQAVLIPAGTIIGTLGGINYTTQNSITLASGTNQTTPVTAVCSIAGSIGNVLAGTIVVIISALSSPLQVTNTQPATGGGDGETVAQTQKRFIAALQSIGKTSPQAVKGAVIGITSGSEVVRYATVYESWVGAATPTPGFVVYIDNGSGAATGTFSPPTGLIGAVRNFLDGATTGQGYRPAGVPYTVSAGSSLRIDVGIIGTLYNHSDVSTATYSINTAIANYFAGLDFGVAAQSSALNATVAQAAAGLFSSLTVNLYNYGASPTVINSATPTGNQRIVLGQVLFSIA